MNSIRKRDYDADLERLKTFIDSYHNNDPETGKKGKILVKFLAHIRVHHFPMLTQIHCTQVQCFDIENLCVLKSVALLFRSNFENVAFILRIPLYISDLINYYNV